jgi:fimbrial chaperone protein
MRLQSTRVRTRRFGTISWAAIAAAWVTGIMLAPGATAATFTVDPTQIFLSGRTGSVLLTLRNDSEETLRFQLSAFAWGQSPSGEMTLEPTDDVVFFPVLLTLQPGELRRVRVGHSTSLDVREKTYRIFVEELPPLTPQGEGVRVLTKMGIPIFLRPQKEVATAILEDVRQQGDHIRFSLANTGTVHFVPREIKVEAATDSATVFSKALEGWYVLAGGRRDYELVVEETDCSRVRSVVVTAAIGAEQVEQRLQTPNGVCRRD